MQDSRSGSGPIAKTANRKLTMPVGEAARLNKELSATLAESSRLMRACREAVKRKPLPRSIRPEEIRGLLETAPLSVSEQPK